MAGGGTAERFNLAMDDLRAVAARVRAGGNAMNPPSPTQAGSTLAQEIERGRLVLLDKWQHATTDAEREVIARAAVLAVAAAHQNPNAGPAPAWLDGEKTDPSDVIYRAAMADVDRSLFLTLERTRTGVVMPRFLMTYNMFRRRRNALRMQWEQAVERGEAGRADRLRVAANAVRFALLVHEQLPGAPPAPPWLEQLSHRRAQAPKPPITIVDETENALRYTFMGGDDDDKKKSSWTSIALIVAAGIVVASFVRGRS